MTRRRLQCVLASLMPLALALAVTANASTLPPTLAQAALDLEAWQLEDATAAALLLAQGSPRDPAVRGLAAAVLHQHGAHADALALLSGVPAADYPPAEVRARIAASAHTAAGFAERRSRHFVLRYRDKDEVTATYAEAVLEAAYTQIGGDLKFLPAERGTPIVVEIYPDARSLGDASGLRPKEIATSGTIAICKFHRLMITSPLALVDGYPWADTLAHELTHLIIAKKSANEAPVWLHEGIAKTLEARWHGPPGPLSPYSENLLQDAVKRHALIPLAKMHPSMALLPSQDAAALAFAEVRTLVEYVVGAHGLDALPRLLLRLRDGSDLQAALRAALGTALGTLAAAGRAGLQRRPFTPHPDAMPRSLRLREAAASPTGGKTAAAPRLSKRRQAVADAARLGELLQLRGHRQAAWLTYRHGLSLTPTPPPDLLLHAARLAAELQQVSDARRLLRQLLVAEPEQGDAHLLAGSLALKQAELAPAQQHLEAARLQNPYDPSLHDGLAELYDRQKKTTAAAQERRFAELCRRPRPAKAAAATAGPKALSLLSPAAASLRQVLCFDTTSEPKERARRSTPPSKHE